MCINQCNIIGLIERLYLYLLGSLTSEKVKFALYSYVDSQKLLMCPLVIP